MNDRFVSVELLLFPTGDDGNDSFVDFFDGSNSVGGDHLISIFIKID